MKKTYTLREAKLILKNRALEKIIAILRDRLIGDDCKNDEIERLKAKIKWMETEKDEMRAMYGTFGEIRNKIAKRDVWIDELIEVSDRAIYRLDDKAQWEKIVTRIQKEREK